MDKLTLALDWTPNINHIGFFVARTLGFYEEEGIDLHILDPSMDDYAYSPAKKVEMGQVDLALCPTESLISYRTKSTIFPLTAIAAILQKDLSAISVLESSGIQNLKDLDGKHYASYEAKYEDGIIRQMIKRAGGKGDITVSYPQRLGVWETLQTGKADATWIFLNWEAVEAEEKGLALKHFPIEPDVPYSYSPVIASSDFLIERKADAFQRFINASRRGYLYSINNPLEATTILSAAVPKEEQHINLHKALERTKNAFTQNGQWGVIDPVKMKEFCEWLKETELEKKAFSTDELFTNQFVKRHTSELLEQD